MNIRGEMLSTLVRCSKASTRSTSVWNTSLCLAAPLILSSSAESFSEHIHVPFHWRYAKIKAALLDYGWPDNFRKDDWVRDICNLQNKLRERWNLIENSMSEEDKEKLWHPESWEETVNRLRAGVDGEGA